MKQTVKIVSIGMVLAFCATATLAQSVQTFKGKLKTLAGTDLVVTTDKGDQPFSLTPDWGVLIVVPAKLSDIKEGSFIGTANVDGPGGGRSLEVHVFPPGVKLGEGDRVMDAATGTKMTNGTVGKVTKSDGGPQFEIAYSGGTRRVTVPKEAVITSTTPADRTYLKPGYAVSVSAIKGADGKMAARFISTGLNGTPPAR